MILAGFVLGLLTAAVAGIVHLWRLGAELVGPTSNRRAAERAAAIREAAASEPDPRFTTPEGSK